MQTHSEYSSRSRRISLEVHPVSTLWCRALQIVCVLWHPQRKQTQKKVLDNICCWGMRFGAFTESLEGSSTNVLYSEKTCLCL